MVAITPRTSLQLTEGAEAKLLITMIVREDAMLLFGFPSEDEREVFDLLRSVTGVGPKSALGVLSAMSVNEIQAAVNSDSDSAFKAVSGIGPKTAKLICVTLSGKMQMSVSAAGIKPVTKASEHILEAIVGLGWPSKLAEVALNRVLEAAPNLDDGPLLKAALADLGQGKSVGA